MILDSRDDADLVRGFQAGSAACFDALFTRHHRPIFNYLYRMIGSRAHAEDLTQDVFLRVFTSLGHSGQILNFRAWLYRVASNVAISQLRKRDRAAVSLEERQEGSAEEAADDQRLEPEALHLQLETAEEVAEGLRLLSESHRQALVLRQLHGLSYQEIAEVMGLSMEAVTSLLHRARRDFRDAFERRSKPGPPEGQMDRARI